MRVLVTGGSGFIGSHVVDLLVTGGQEVVSVENLNPAAPAGAPGYPNPAAEHRVVPLSDLAAAFPITDEILDRYPTTSKNREARQKK